MERFSSWDAAMNDRDEDARADVFDDLDSELHRWEQQEPVQSYDDYVSSAATRSPVSKESFSERVKQMEEDLDREIRSIQRATDASDAFHKQLLAERTNKQNHVYRASSEEAAPFHYNDRVRSLSRTREERELDGIEHELEQLSTKQSLRREASQAGALHPGHRQLSKFSDSRRQKWSESLKREDEERLRTRLDAAYDAGTLNGSNAYDLSDSFYTSNGYELRPSRLVPPTNDRHRMMDDGSWHKASGRPGSGEQGRPAQKPFHQKRLGIAPFKESYELSLGENDPTLAMEKNEQRIKDAIEMRNVERRHELEESFDDWMERHGYGEGTREDGTYDPFAYKLWMQGQQRLLDEYDPDHTPNY